ncbi:MAG: hypothetical protein CSA75_03015 [Sorangium cellulosum]|nr:MAG: hypothetical protein CSA75_03015 [Sorangium cellulosum]
MEPARPRIGELLVDARIIAREQLEEVLAIQKNDGRRLGTLLVERGLVNETQLTQILSQQLSVPWVSLYHVDFSKRLLNMVPSRVAQKYCLVPIYVRHVRGQGDTLYVAMDDPTNLDALHECASWSGLPTRAMIASPADIRRAVEVYYGLAPEEEQNDDETVRESADEGEEQDADVGLAIDVLQPSEEELETESAGGKNELEDGEKADNKSCGEEPAPASEVEREAETQAEVESSTPPPAMTTLASGTLKPLDQVDEAPPGLNAEEEVSVEVGEEMTLEELLAQRDKPPHEKSARPKSKAGLLSLTLLDGTTLALPVVKKKKKPSSLVGSIRERHQGEVSAPTDRPPQEVVYEHLAGEGGLTVRDIISTLRAAIHGVDPSEALGRHAKWEAMVAALLAILIRKGLITEEELLEELRKI